MTIRAALLIVLGAVTVANAPCGLANEVDPFQPTLKVKLTPTDGEGALIFKASNYPELFYLAFGRLDQGDPIRSDVLLPSRGPFRVRPDGTAAAGPPVLHSVRMKPGHYMLTTYNHNAQWEACLARSTVAFDIHPGEASYIGELDFAPVRESIFSIAKARGDEKTTHIHALNRYYEGISGPRLVSRPEVDVDEIRSIIRQIMPRMTAPVVARSAEPAIFGRGQAKPKSC